MYRVRVWDLPTRLFHWSLALAVVALFITANVGGNWMTWHLRFGYLVCVLLFFRLLWGFAGGLWSRFQSFPVSPRHIISAFRKDLHPLHQIGHTPLGSLSVLAMLVFLSLQVASGLMTDDEIAFYGPLVPHASSQLVALASHYHREIGKFLVLALVISHLLALLYYKLSGAPPLVGPMITGDKHLPMATSASEDDRRSRLRALLFAALSLFAVGTLIYLT